MGKKIKKVGSFGSLIVDLSEAFERVIYNLLISMLQGHRSDIKFNQLSNQILHMCSIFPVANSSFLEYVISIFIVLALYLLVYRVPIYVQRFCFYCCSVLFIGLDMYKRCHRFKRAILLYFNERALLVLVKLK